MVSMDDFKMVLGMEFLDKITAFPLPFANDVYIMDGNNMCMISVERSVKIETKTLFAMQFKKGFRKGETSYLAFLQESPDDELVEPQPIKTSTFIQIILDKYKDDITQRVT